MRKSNTQDLRAVINDLLKQSSLDHRYLAQSVIDEWPEIVGPLFAKYTTNIYESKGTLFVNISSAAAKNELVMAKSILIKNINERVGEEVIKDIVVR